MGDGVRIDVRTNVADVQRELRRLQSDIQQRAIARALNRTMDQGQTQMVRAIASEFEIKQSEVRARLSIRRAREGYFGGLLTVDLFAFQNKRGRGFNLIRFVEKRVTLAERMEAAAEWVNRDTTVPCVVWVERNDEGDMMRKLLPEGTEVRGDEPFEDKRAKLRDFSLGNIRVLITKPSIAGFGMNWQHCHRTVIASMTFSFERTFQLIRRFYRYGQTHPVELAMVSASSEGNVVAALQRKETQYQVMQDAMNRAMRATGLLARVTTFDDYDYTPTKAMKLPSFLRVA